VETIDCYVNQEESPKERLQQIPCEEILIMYSELIDESRLKVKENILIVSNHECFFSKKEEEIKTICKEGHKVFFLVKPGEKISVGETVGFVYSEKRVVRKIKAQDNGIVLAIIQSPFTRPEKTCVLLKTLEADEHGRKH
jgi:hypothetical protein